MGINFDIKNSEKLIEKIPFKGILAVITIIAAFAILSPDWLLEKLFLLEIRNTVGTYLGLILVVCLSVWIIIIAVSIAKIIKKKAAFNSRNSKKRFALLSKDALITVLKMYRSPSHSMYLDVGDATTVVLESCSFVGRGTITAHGLNFDYFLHPWVVEYLNKHFTEYEHLLEER